MSRIASNLLVSCLFVLASLSVNTASAATVTGDLAKWHPINLDFQGPFASESDVSPNPFLDYRLNVSLTSPSGQTIVVPGFFDGDGRGNGTGSVWRVRFTANEVGEWSYQANLRQGKNVAVELSPNAGSAAQIDGSQGTFVIGEHRDDAPGFLSKGRLSYVGKHYLKFDDGGYWVKGGTDSPENLLGYSGFDDTVNQGGINKNFLHDFSTHEQDWNNNDPLFQSNQSGDDSRGLIGALNYLHNKGVNSIYFLPMNLGGDGQDSYPFIGANNTSFDKTHYDISKLGQWTRVFDHAQRKGIFLHFVFTETERANERWLDNGNLGVERKLFFREIIARFGYALAGKWNLGEENDFPVSELRKHARYIDELDWSNKPISVHTQINDFKDYNQIVGDKLFTATSIQYDWQFAGEFVERWRKQSTEQGQPWILDMDENTGGVSNKNAHIRRKQILYDVYFSGGQIEWYFGYHPLPLGGDVTAGNFRLRENVWNYTTHARKFLENELPFWEMQPTDNLVTGENNLYGGAEVFAKTGDIYAIYFPQASNRASLDLSGISGSFSLRWYNPRTGEFAAGNSVISAGGRASLGLPPSDVQNDWVALVKREGYRFSQPGPNNIPLPDSDAASNLEEHEDVLTDSTPAVAVTKNTAPPRFSSFKNPTAIAGERLSFTVTAVDDDGIAPVVTVTQDLPAGMGMNGPGGGILQFEWQVPANQSESVSFDVVAMDTVAPNEKVALNVTINIQPSDDQPDAAASMQSASSQNNPSITNVIASEQSTQTENSSALIESSRSPSNSDQAPILVSVFDRMVMVGERLQLPVIAVDPDGFVPSVWSNNLPKGALLIDTGKGTRSLSWTPTPAQLGLHMIELIVQDAREPSLQVTHEWRLTVIDQTVDTAPLFNPPAEVANTNYAPIFPAYGAMSAQVGKEFVFMVRPIDPEGAAPHLQLNTEIENASFADAGNGGRILKWVPTAADIGATTFEFIATDSADISIHSTVSVEVTVTAPTQ